MTDLFRHKATYLRSAKFSLFQFLLVTLSPVASQEIAASEVKILLPQQDPQAVLYISPGAVVHGLEQLSIEINEEIIYIAPGTTVSGQLNISVAKTFSKEKISRVQPQTDNHQKALVTSKDFLIEKIEKTATVRALENKVKEQVLKTIFTTGTSSPFSILNYYRSNDNGLISNNTASSFADIVNLIVCIEDNLDLQNIKQDFYKNEEHLTSCCLTTTFLRGPPLQMV